MGTVLVDNKVLDGLDFIKSSVSDIKADISIIKTYLDDSKLTAEEREDINCALKAKKTGKLIKAQKVFA